MNEADRTAPFPGAAQWARRIASGEATAREAVDWHIARIEAVDGKLNAVPIRRFEEARHEATAADERQSRGEPLGPLHGVPITIKACYHVAGTTASIGVVGGDVRSTSDSVLVARLLAAGAIVLGKTNLPQLMIFHETDNPVYGRTNNPWDCERSPGGSSGGEGAIVAAGGSTLGLANDLGGSIRQPAHSNGIAGLKPTSHRLTCVDTLKNFRGMEAFFEQAGPLARRVEDLELAMKVLAAPGLERSDALMAPVDWNPSSSVRIEGLRIAMWTDDGFFRAAPAIRRAVEEAGKFLETRGAVVEPFTPPNAARAVELYIRTLSADGAADLLRLIDRSPKDPRVAQLLALRFVPAWLRGPLGAALGAAGQKRLGWFIARTGRLSADGYWQLVVAIREYVADFMKAFYSRGFDAAICPPHAFPALRHGAADYLASAASYCMLGNVLQWPAGVVPFTRVRPGEEGERGASRDLVERRAAEVEAGSAGLPVGVQVAAGHWREDIVLAVMRALEEHAMRQSDFPSRPPL